MDEARGESSIRDGNNRQDVINGRWEDRLMGG